MSRYPTLKTFQSLFERRVDPERDDPALIGARLDAWKAWEKAKKSGNSRRMVEADARLSELKELR